MLAHVMWITICYLTHRRVSMKQFKRIIVAMVKTIGLILYVVTLPITAPIILYRRNRIMTKILEEANAIIAKQNHSLRKRYAVDTEYKATSSYSS